MADFLKAAQDWLGDIRTTSLATENTITYTRADDTVLVLTGVVVAAYQRSDESLIDAGSALLTERRDYIIPVDELVGGVPVDGEVVMESQDTTDYYYVVTGEFGERSWEWHDRTRSAYRIHTIFNREIT